MKNISGKAKSPNILFILIDDLGWSDTSCYGSKFYETPHIDALSQRGVRFTDAYAASPVCSPTRASLLTGRYPSSIGVTNYIDIFGDLHPARGKLNDASYFRELPLTEKSIARTLKEGGYRTWHIGKWHLGSTPTSPEAHGFEVNIGGSKYGRPYKCGYFSPWDTLPGLDDADVPEGAYLTDYLTDRAIELIRGNDSEEAPFFLNLWYYAVHTPIEAKKEKILKYKKKAARLGLDKKNPFTLGEFFPTESKKADRINRRTFQSDPVYAAMIESVDENIGRLMDTLRETGQDKNTLVIFTSDNGGLSSADSSPTCNYPLSEGKGWRYEGGIREPLIVTWPGKIEPGRIVGEPVISPDFYPTILEVSGCVDQREGKLPYPSIDGESFLPLLLGYPWKRKEPLFWHFPHYGNQGDTPGAAIRDGEWKMLEFFEGGQRELYHISEDPGEENDLSETKPELLLKLTRALHRWETSVGAQRPVLNPDYTPWKGRVGAGKKSLGSTSIESTDSGGASI